MKKFLLFLAFVLNICLVPSHAMNRIHKEAEDSNRVHPPLHFGYFPDEIFMHILKFLPERDFYSLKAVNKDLCKFIRGIFYEVTGGVELDEEERIAYFNPKHVKQFGWEWDFKHINDLQHLDLSQGKSLRVLRYAIGHSISPLWMVTHSEYLKAQSSTLETIDLSYGKFSSAWPCTQFSLQDDVLGSKKLGEILTCLTKLETLRLSSCNLQKKDLPFISQSFRALKNLSELCLGDNPINDEGAEMLAPAIGQLSSLQKLVLPLANTTEKGASQYKREFPRLTSLKSLTLTDINSKNAVYVLRGIRELTNLECLSLNVSSESYVDIISLPAFNCTLSRLINLSEMNLSVIIPGNKRCPGHGDWTNDMLPSLNLPLSISTLELSIKSADPLDSFLKIPTSILSLSLTSLCLSNCQVHDPSDISRIIGSLSGLRKLALYGNFRSSPFKRNYTPIQGYSLLFSTLSHPTKLENLILNLDMDDNGFREISSHLPNLKGLKRLDLSKNCFFTRIGADIIMKSFPTLSMIETLTLGRSILEKELPYQNDEEEDVSLSFSRGKKAKEIENFWDNLPQNLPLSARVQWRGCCVHEYSEENSQ